MMGSSFRLGRRQILRHRNISIWTTSPLGCRNLPTTKPVSIVAVAAVSGSGMLPMVQYGPMSHGPSMHAITMMCMGMGWSRVIEGAVIECGAGENNGPKAMDDGRTEGPLHIPSSTCSILVRGSPRQLLLRELLRLSYVRTFTSRNVNRVKEI